MNVALKHWKEAATLILAAGHRVPAVTPAVTPEVTPEKTLCDYDVLMLKRSSRSGFMPNAYVFPGGLLDPSDFSSDWLQVFGTFAHLEDFGLRRVRQTSRPRIFSTDRRSLGSRVSGDVAFRICALRETFEESGIFLFVNKHEQQSLLRRLSAGAGFKGGPLQDNTQHVGGAELSRWRSLVLQDPLNLVRMCRELQLVPNIWALHEWGNWLTPAGRYGASRFDTAFFMCCLQGAPLTTQDQREIVRFQWSTPPELLRSYREQQLWIAPPQIYELSRMCRLTRLSDLHQFSRDRAVEGCDQWLPVLSREGEELISALPGDRLHPSSAQSDPDKDSSLHRFVGSDPYSTRIQMNVPSTHKHLQPLVQPEESSV